MDHAGRVFEYVPRPLYLEDDPPPPHELRAALAEVLRQYSSSFCNLLPEHNHPLRRGADGQVLPDSQQPPKKFSAQGTELCDTVAADQEYIAKTQRAANDLEQQFPGLSQRLGFPEDAVDRLWQESVQLRRYPAALTNQNLQTRYLGREQFAFPVKDRTLRPEDIRVHGHFYAQCGNPIRDATRAVYFMEREKNEIPLTSEEHSRVKPFVEKVREVLSGLPAMYANTSRKQIYAYLRQLIVHTVYVDTLRTCQKLAANPGLSFKETQSLIAGLTHKINEAYGAWGLTTKITTTQVYREIGAILENFLKSPELAIEPTRPVIAGEELEQINLHSPSDPRFVPLERSSENAHFSTQDVHRLDHALNLWTSHRWESGNAAVDLDFWSSDAVKSHLYRGSDLKTKKLTPVTLWGKSTPNLHSTAWTLGGHSNNIGTLLVIPDEITSSQSDIQAQYQALNETLEALPLGFQKSGLIVPMILIGDREERARALQNIMRRAGIFSLSSDFDAPIGVIQARSAHGTIGLRGFRTNLALELIPPHQYYDFSKAFHQAIDAGADGNDTAELFHSHMSLARRLRLLYKTQGQTQHIAEIHLRDNAPYLREIPGTHLVAARNDNGRSQIAVLHTARHGAMDPTFKSVRVVDVTEFSPPELNRQLRPGGPRFGIPAHEPALLLHGTTTPVEKARLMWQAKMALIRAFGVSVKCINHDTDLEATLAVPLHRFAPTARVSPPGSHTVHATIFDEALKEMPPNNHGGFNGVKQIELIGGKKYTLRYRMNVGKFNGTVLDPQLLDTHQLVRDLHGTRLDSERGFPVPWLYHHVDDKEVWETITGPTLAEVLEGKKSSENPNPQLSNQELLQYAKILVAQSKFNTSNVPRPNRERVNTLGDLLIHPDNQDTPGLYEYAMHELDEISNFTNLNFSEFSSMLPNDLEQLRELHSRLVTDVPSMLCHSDPHLRNIIKHDDPEHPEGSQLFLLDWDLARVQTL
ncbi:MAG: phosphotransferase, partial [Corynebacteriales bacterium]|nr:phosphotransferase [Mycobacteriales bacterium]